MLVGAGEENTEISDLGMSLKAWALQLMKISPQTSSRFGWVHKYSVGSISKRLEPETDKLYNKNHITSLLMQLLVTIWFGKYFPI